MSVLAMDAWKFLGYTVHHSYLTGLLTCAYELSIKSYKAALKLPVLQWDLRNQVLWWLGEGEGKRSQLFFFPLKVIFFFFFPFWRINSCVGEQNHQAFILALFFFMLTSLYGIVLTLDTICRGRTPFTALFYCPGAYSDYRWENWVGNSGLTRQLSSLAILHCVLRISAIGCQTWSRSAP